MSNHSFIYNGEELFAFGCNSVGQLGLDNNRDRNTAT